MYSKELKVLHNSDYYIHTPSTNARRLFFYPLITGFFQYQEGYAIHRKSLNSFLLMYIRKGECEVRAGGKCFLAHRGQVIFLDCYKPHSYRALTNMDVEWVHFDGAMARSYYDTISENSDPVISLQDTYRFERYLHKIYVNFRDRMPIQEALLSNYIVNLLTELFVNQDEESMDSSTSGIIEDTIAYIGQHLTDELSLQKLADQVSLSPYYFSRLFKKETGYSPHNYVITMRINHAKFLLRTTEESVKNICFTTGFNSESSFCTCFLKMTGFTPSAYREELMRSNTASLVE